VVSFTPPTALPPGKEHKYPLCRKVRGPPAPSQSLYRLHYSGTKLNSKSNSLTFFFLWLCSPIQALATSMKLSVSLQLLDLGQSVGLLWTGDQLVAKPLPVHKTQTLNIRAQSGIRTYGPGIRASEDSSCLRRLG
jgi:hypothetical protein